MTDIMISVANSYLVASLKMLIVYFSLYSKTNAHFDYTDHKNVLE